SGRAEGVPRVERAGVRERRAEPNPREKIRPFARTVRPMLERLAPIWFVVLEAAPSDKELSSLVDELQQRHAGSMRLVIEHLLETGRLRPHMSKDIARDVVWAMNSPEFYGLLVGRRGWTGAMFERWLTDAWQRLLLEDLPALKTTSPPSAS